MFTHAAAKAALAVALAVILLNLPFWTSPSLREQGDLAANAIQVERAREFKELLGPYSWHNFHHPGPVSFYGQALSEPLFFFLPTPLAKHSAFQLVVSLLLVLWTVRLLRRAGLPPALAAAALLVLLAPLVFLTGGFPIMLASLWGPVVVVFPMLLFVVASAGILAGDHEALPAAALGATIAWQNHLPTVPLLAIATVAFVFMARPWAAARTSRPARVSLWAALIIAALGWLPPLYEELTHSPGNLTLIARYLWSTPPGLHPWSEVLAQLGPAFTDPWAVVFRKGASVHSPWLVMTLVASLAFVCAIQFRRSARPWRLVIAQTWAAILITALAARHIGGELQTYLFYYLYGVAGLLGVFVAKELWDRWPARRLESYRTAPALIGIIGLVPFLALIAGHRLPAPAAPDVYAELIANLDLTAAAAVYLERGQGPDDADAWQKVPALALALRRAGVRVTVSETDVLLCSEEMRSRPDVDRPLSLLVTRRPPQGPGIRYQAVEDWGVVIGGPPLLPSRGS